MASKAKSAEKLLTLVPTVWYKMNPHGFHGALYRPTENRYPGKAMIMLGSEDGQYALTRYMAEIFVREGMTVLALAVCGVEGLPQKFEELPLEMVEKAADRLGRLGIRKIILWGYSLGATAALSAAALCPEKISGVVAINGTDFLPQSMSAAPFSFHKKSCFGWKGEPLPYEPLKCGPLQIAGDCLREQSYVLRSCFAGTTEHLKNENAFIPAERITCPVLLLTAHEDQMWPAEAYAKRLIHRLDENDAEGEHTHMSFATASHWLLPAAVQIRRRWKMEREHSEECTASRQVAHRLTMEFLGRV